MSSKRPPRLVVVCDFDVTITNADTTDGILEECAYDDWWAIEALWKNDQITALECMEEQTICIREGQLTRIQSYLEGVAVGDHFVDFVKFCKDHQVDLLIESDGYDYAIEYVLKRQGIRSDQIRSNRLVKMMDESFRLEFPYFARGCAAGTGVCKCAIARTLTANRSISPPPLVVIGNDRTDQCVAGRADRVFARETRESGGNELALFCKERRLDCQGFTNFGTVIEGIEELLRG